MDGKRRPEQQFLKETQPWPWPQPSWSPTLLPSHSCLAQPVPLREDRALASSRDLPRPHLRPGLLSTIHALGLLLIQHEPVLVAEFRHLLPLVVHSLHGWIVGDDVFQGLPLGDSQSLTPASSSPGRLNPRLLGVGVYPDLTQLRRGTRTNPRKLSALCGCQRRSCGKRDLGQTPEMLP